MTKVAVLYICTGKYIKFWGDFFASAEKYLLPDCQKEYFVFTDASQELFTQNKKIHLIYQEQLKFPYPTLYRFRFFLKVEREVLQFDYCFFFNANIIFQATIKAEEFLPNESEKFSAVIHPGYFNVSNKEYTLEKNKKSTAYTDYRTVSNYYMGSLIGGIAKNFMEACHIMDNNIKKDEASKRMAVWHDESHWNHYLSTLEYPFKQLHPGYVYPEGYNIPFEQKAILLDKNIRGGHDQLRDISVKEKIFKKIKKIKKFIFNNK